MLIQSLDFHYHAGLERPAGTSLRDHLDHARMTGRRVLALTDHLQFYWPEHTQPNAGAAYEHSVAGLARYRAEVDALKPEFSDLTLLFAPEIPPKTKMADIPDDVLALADCFICEQAFRGDEEAIDANTQVFVDRLAELRDFTRATGKPAFLAHPFRLSINHRLVKRRIEPWVTQLAPERAEKFSPAQMKRFFLLDVERIAAAAAEWRVPMEVNGSTEARVRAANLPSALRIMRDAYRLFADAGVELVPGSDQHGFTESYGRMGAYVPYETFEELGLSAKDIRFARSLWEQPPLSAGA